MLTICRVINLNKMQLFGDIIGFIVFFTLVVTDMFTNGIPISFNNPILLNLDVMQGSWLTGDMEPYQIFGVTVGVLAVLIPRSVQLFRKVRKWIKRFRRR